MGLLAPSMGSILSSTPFYQNYFSQPVSYTVDVLSQIPQASGTVENITKADPSLAGYQATPNYVAALSNYNEVTNNNPNYWQTVTDIPTMEQLDEAQYELAKAKSDYWNTALSPEYTAPEDAKINTFGNLYPVGVNNGAPVQASFSGTPTYQYYLDNGEIKYSEPDRMDPLAEIFIPALMTGMGFMAGGPVGAAALGSSIGAASGSAVADTAADRPVDWTKAGISGVAAYGVSSLTNGISNYLSGLNAFGEGLAGASGAETTGYLARQAAQQAANGMYTVSNADIANSLWGTAKDVAPTALKVGRKIAQIAALEDAPGLLGGAIAPILYNQPSWKSGGLMNLTQTPSSVSSSSSLNTPSFTKTPLPSLSTYGESKEKKLAELLSNPYKNYTVSDYLLYKQDPEKIQDILERYT